MKDIARDLGVSVVTISKVLRNHPDVGDETRERVLARVKELDYRPNLAARSLVTGRSYLIGLVVPDLLHPFFAEIAKSISEVLRKSGYYLIVSSSEEDPDLEEQEISKLLARRLDALVIATCRPTVDLQRSRCNGKDARIPERVQNGSIRLTALPATCSGTFLRLNRSRQMNRGLRGFCAVLLGA